MSNTNYTPSRRKFVKQLSSIAAAAGATQLNWTSKESLILPYKKPIGKTYSANDTIGLAVVGMGIMGNKNLETAIQIPGTKLIGVCDLYDGRLERSKEVYGKDIITTRDYEELLDNDDVDAVYVATSDHWHDKIAIAALKKGKHVYCEKPMVHQLEEGHGIIKAQKSSGKVLQVGSQRVSSIVYQAARDRYKAGDIGELVLAEIFYDRQSALGAWQYSIPTDASAKTVDWKRFIGDAPDRPYDPMRFFRWRNYQDYGTGVAGDLFVHLFSGLHMILESKGPDRIYATGGLRYWKDGRDVPDIMLGSYDYPETDSHPAFNVQMRVNFIDGGGGGSAIRLVGTEGVMTIGWNDIKIVRSKLPEAPGYGGWDTFFTFTEAQQAEYKKWYESTYPKKPAMKGPKEMTYSAPDGYSDHWDHHWNFLKAVRAGTPVLEDAEFGLQAAGPALATNMSYFQNKIINWDPVKMIVT
ncbi:MAG: Gfo/Idh/MocA family oxidoreductase [Bacteroidota bacterium]